MSRTALVVGGSGPTGPYVTAALSDHVDEESRVIEADRRATGGLLARQPAMSPVVHPYAHPKVRGQQDHRSR